MNVHTVSNDFFVDTVSNLGIGNVELLILIYFYSY